MARSVIAAFLVCLVMGCHRWEDPKRSGQTNEPPMCTVEAEPEPAAKPEKEGDSAMKMTVRKATDEEIAKLGIKSWPIWTYDPEAQPPEFPWHYDSKEVCYIIEGEVTVEADGQSITFGPGDIVEFPSDLDCVWKVGKAVRKHYKFE